MCMYSRAHACTWSRNTCADQTDCVYTATYKLKKQGEWSRRNWRLGVSVIAFGCRDGDRGSAIILVAETRPAQPPVSETFESMKVQALAPAACHEVDCIVQIVDSGHVGGGASGFAGGASSSQRSDNKHVPRQVRKHR